MTVHTRSQVYSSGKQSVHCSVSVVNVAVFYLCKSLNRKTAMDLYSIHNRDVKDIRVNEHIPDDRLDLVQSHSLLQLHPSPTPLSPPGASILSQ